VKIRKCEAFRDSVNFLGTNGIFRRNCCPLKVYTTVLKVVTELVSQSLGGQKRLHFSKVKEEGEVLKFEDF